MEKVVVVAGQRTPFGSFGGSLLSLSATDLGVVAAKASLEQAGVSPELIDHIIFGNVVQSSSDAPYLARHIGLRSGTPISAGALTINRLCGSGFQSWISAAQMLLTGESTAVLAGGTEQMSQIPYIARSLRFGGIRMGHGELEDYMTSALTDSYAGTPMAITAENLGEKYAISREACDEYSYQTQQRYAAGLAKGVFQFELTSVVVEDKKGSKAIEADEHPKPGVTLEKICSMKPLFKKDGLVTPATASGIVDGAACSLLMTEAQAGKLGLKAYARIIGWATVGCQPEIMGIGPAYAAKKALEKAGLSLKDMDLVEVNEAFAAQYLAVQKELGLDSERTNVNGGAIAVGHPLAASGTRIMNHLMYELERRQGRYALGSACIGGGQGIAIIIERLKA